ncbi:hypothetical protein ACJX0J_005590 [Zea mays]
MKRNLNYLKLHTIKTIVELCVEVIIVINEIIIQDNIDLQIFSFLASALDAQMLLSQEKSVREQKSYMEMKKNAQAAGVENQHRITGTYNIMVIYVYGVQFQLSKAYVIKRGQIIVVIALVDALIILMLQVYLLKDNTFRHENTETNKQYSLITFSNRKSWHVVVSKKWTDLIFALM